MSANKNRCQCGGKIVTNDTKNIKFLKCKECEAIVFKESFGIRFTLKEMKELLAGESIFKTLISKKGKEYSCWLEMKDGKVIQNFDKEPPAFCECQCGGSVVNKGALYVCNSCECRVMKKTAGVELTGKEIEKLFSGESIYREDFVSKEGKNFSASLVFNKPGEWAEFEFEQELGDEEEESEADILFGGGQNKEEYTDEEVGDEDDEETIFDENGNVDLNFLVG